MIELKKPSVMGINDSEKIEELRRYLNSFVDDLQFALQDLEKQINGVKTAQASAVATADYTAATPDAMAFDGMAYSGEEIAEESVEATEEPIVETTEETIEGGEEDEQ